MNLLMRMSILGESLCVTVVITVHMGADNLRRLGAWSFKNGRRYEEEICGNFQPPGFYSCGATYLCESKDDFTISRNRVPGRMKL